MVVLLMLRGSVLTLRLITCSLFVLFTNRLRTLQRGDECLLWKADTRAWGSNGERKRKTTALSRLTFDSDLTAMSLHNLFGDRQAQPTAAGRARTRAISPVEALKEIGQVFRRNAHPAIPHADPDH